VRLIDLDQKIFVPIVDESKGGVEYEMEMTIGEMLDKFLDGFQPEIVDAIPVEWMKKVRNDADDAGDIEMRDSITGLLLEWQKGQEAQM
jgi:hypothetical protein